MTEPLHASLAFVRSRTGPAPMLTLAFLISGALTMAAADSAEKRVRAPVTLQLLERRAQFQRSAASAMTAFHDFQFTNQIEASGIRFEHQFVDDAGRDYKAAQYDHGNGVAVADIDGDGRLDLYFTTQRGSNGLWRNLLLYGAPSQDAVSHPEYLAAGGNPKGFHTDEIIRRRLTDLVKDGHLIPNAVRGIAKREAMSA